MSVQTVTCACSMPDGSPPVAANQEEGMCVSMSFPSGRVGQVDHAGLGRLRHGPVEIARMHLGREVPGRVDPVGHVGPWPVVLVDALRLLAPEHRLAGRDEAAEARDLGPRGHLWQRAAKLAGERAVAARVALEERDLDLSEAKTLFRRALLDGEIQQLEGLV